MELGVKLKRNSWHNKLQSWTLGENKPDLYSLCPYFWLSILCVFIIPLTIVYKIFDYVIVKIDKSFSDRYDNWVKSLDMIDIATLYLYEDGSSKNIRKKKPYTFKSISSYGIYYSWRSILEKQGKSYDEINNILNAAIVKSKLERTKTREAEDLISAAMYAEIDRKREKKEKRKMFWIPAVMWTKRIFNLALSLFIMWSISSVINIVVVNIEFESVVITLKTFGYIVLVLAILALVALFVSLSIDKIKNINIPSWFKHLSYVPVKIGQVFTFIFKSIVSAFSLFISYFKATKNDYCPAIEWDDDEK